MQLRWDLLKEQDGWKKIATDDNENFSIIDIGLNTTQRDYLTFDIMLEQ